MRTTTRFHMNTGNINLKHLIDEEARGHEKHIRSDPATGHVFERWDQNGYNTVEEAYEGIFGDMLEEYNAKQKNKDRRLSITDFMDKMKNDKRGKPHKVKVKRDDGSIGYELQKREEKRLVYEVTLSCGNTTVFEKDDYGSPKYYRSRATGGICKNYMEKVPEEVNKAVCRRYMETFEDRNPSLRVAFCAWHGEEGYTNKRGSWEYGIGHAQFGFVPVGEYDRGLPLRASIGRALAQQGITDQKTSKGFVCAYEVWQKREQDYMERLLHEEYAKYCETHPKYYANKGDLEIYHPIASGERDSDSVSPAVFAELQETEEQIAINRHRAKKTKEDADQIKSEADQTLQQAKKQADQIKNEANEYADQIKRQARAEADKLINETKEEMQAKMNDLDTQVYNMAKAIAVETNEAFARTVSPADQDRAVRAAKSRLNQRGDLPLIDVPTETPKRGKHGGKRPFGLKVVDYSKPVDDTQFGDD